MQQTDLIKQSPASWPLETLEAIQAARASGEIDAKQAAAIIYDWERWARPEQLAPTGDWFVWLLRSGRGYGKTRTGAEWIRDRVANGYKRIALVGKTKADVRDTMVELGDSSLLQIIPPWERPEHEPTKRRLSWPNGAVAMFYSGDEPDQLRGPQHDTAWVDELAKFKYPQMTWDNLLFGMRIGAKPQICVTTTPRPISLLKKLIASPTTIDIRRPTWDNIDNLSPTYMREVIEPYRGTRLGRQEIEGELLDDNPGALWKRSYIEDARVTHAPPELAWISVGVDPAVTNTEESNQTGIIVVGLGADNHFYVLDDLTLRASPHGWGAQAVAAYHRHKADLIVAEVNQGGDMVEHVIQTVDAAVPYRAVRASRGKHVRAQPIAALYEQGKVHHVGTFPELEDQMCQWEPGDESPDRLDGLVWGLTDLNERVHLPDLPSEGIYVYDEPVNISPY